MNLDQALNLNECHIDLNKYKDYPKIPSFEPSPMNYGRVFDMHSNLNLGAQLNWKNQSFYDQPEAKMSSPYLKMKHFQEMQTLLEGPNSNQTTSQHLHIKQQMETKRNEKMKPVCAYN